MTAVYKKYKMLEDNKINQQLAKENENRKSNV